MPPTHCIGRGKCANGLCVNGRLALLSALLLFFLPQRAGETAGIVAFYFLLNMAYCIWLKRHAIIDVCTVAFGFVLRLLAGGMACDDELDLHGKNRKIDAANLDQ